jgi:hypothetical protein
MDKPADKAREQMRLMGLSAPYIGSKETRTKEEVAADRQTLAENVPILGEAMLAKEIADDVKDENYLSAGLNTLALGVGAIPGAGDILNKPIRAAAKKLRKVDKEVATKMLSDVDSIETWKKQNPNPKPQKQNPDVEKSANDLLEGKITGKQHRSVVKENMPIVKIDEVPEMPSFTEIVGALDKDKSAKGILGLNKSVKDGTRVSSRLDIPAYERFDKWVVSVHDAFDKKGKESLNGDIVGYGKTAVLKNVDFKGLPQGAANIAAKRNPKGTIARIFGDYYNAEPENVVEYAKRVIKNKNWTQVGYNPFRHGFFYDKDTGMPVKSAEEVIQVGPLVLAKNAQKIKLSEAKQVGPKGGLKIRTGKPIEGLQNLKETKTVFNKGGAVPMNSMAKQMDMFEEGGLMDEGGTVDPVSGNDVPPGSTQEEVRDDIPAQLSEGEFVFPADVVRYFGLEKLMKMRQEAKAGLARMEAMGQMGNSEEATLPDDIPFSIEDLDTEDEGEYNTPQEFAYGGIVQMPGTNYTTTPNPGPTTGFRPYVAPSIPGYTPQPIQAGPQYQGIQLPGTQFIGSTEKTNIPTFGQTIGTNPGQYDEFRTYVNSSGQTLRIPFKNGQPLYPIPEGYTLQKEDAVKTESTVLTTTVGQDDGGGDGGDRLSGTVGTTTLGTKTATDKDHEEAFGGNVNAMSHKGYSKAVATLGMNQLGTLGTTGLAQQMSNAFAGTKMGESLGVPTFDTFNDVGIAMNQGRNMALSALGLANMGQVTTNAQYDAITAAMVAAKESPARYGLAVSKELTKHQEAIKTGQVAAMQGMGFKSTDLLNPAAVEQARAFYDFDISTINAEMDEVTRAGTVRDKDGKPINTKSGVVMLEKARQELKDLNKTKQELEAKKTSLDLAAANNQQEGLPSGVPSSPADFGALSPEDIANAIDNEADNNSAPGMGNTGDDTSGEDPGDSNDGSPGGMNDDGTDGNDE